MCLSAGVHKRVQLSAGLCGALRAVGQVTEGGSCAPGAACWAATKVC